MRQERSRRTHLDWEVVGPEAEMVSATHRRELGAHVHFQMLEEVVILCEVKEGKNNRQREYFFLAID